MNPRTSLISTLVFVVCTAVSVAEELTKDHSIMPPENWYQVEVILFSHAGGTNEEEAPNNNELRFPNEIIELIDQEALARAKAQQMKGALIKPKASQPIKNISNLFEFVYPTIVRHDDELHDTDAEASTAEILPSPFYFQQLPPPEPWKAEFENPYELLLPRERDLNDSARGLDRREYNVLFHEAWRFSAEDKDNAKWILINAGEHHLNRNELEGSLRFYKSRFLHFETNLWRTIFMKEGSQEVSQDALKIFELPTVPILEPAQEYISSWRIVPTQNSTNIDPLDIEFSPLTNNNIGAGIVNIVGSNYALEPYDIENLPQKEIVLADLISASSIWPIRHSKRIEEGEIYYLDHPKIGIIVLIKNYLPEPINLPKAEEIAIKDS